MTKSVAGQWPQYSTLLFQNNVIKLHRKFFALTILSQFWQ